MDMREVTSLRAIILMICNPRVMGVSLGSNSVDGIPSRHFVVNSLLDCSPPLIRYISAGKDGQITIFIGVIGSPLLTGC